MSDSLILYPQSLTATVDHAVLVIPATNIPLSIDDIAKKDVPKGVPYKIMAKSALPATFAEIDAMTFDFTVNDGIGGDYGPGSTQVVVEWLGDIPVTQDTGVINPIPEKPAPVVPNVISDRQFAQGLAARGFITTDEALAWVKTGTLPAAIANFLAGLPSDQAFAANMLLSGATQFERNHPLVSVFGSKIGMDSAALDAFWIYCASL